MRPTAASSRHALRFWLALLGGNFLLFLPRTLLAGATTAWWPSIHRWAEVGARSSPDPWRVGLEWLLLLAAWLHWSPLWSPRGRRIGARIAFGLLLTFVLYQVYEAVVVEVYHRRPNWANDWLLLREGLPFLLSGLHLAIWVYAAVGVGLGLTLVLVYSIASTPFTRVDPARLPTMTRRGVLALALFALLWCGLRPSVAATPRGEVASLGLKLAANWRATQRTRRQVRALQRADWYRVYDAYRAYSLAERPNLYLFFLESYGSVLLSDPRFRPRYEALMQRVQQELAAAGWHMASGRSISPVWGGGSWMAYTSVLFGVPIAQQSQYLALKERFQGQPYPHLGRYLQSQGYRFVWVVPIHRRLSVASQTANQRFYGPDVWLTFADLDYHGPEYGWGPSPPDQYTLGFLRAWLRGQSAQPTFVLFLTQNTHYYFAPVPPLVDDWRALNNPAIDNPDDYPSVSRPEAYMRAVEYDWAVLADFIREAGPDDVFVLIGDHQPPLVSGRDDGYDTILHIIARDAPFVSSFTAYGLTPGMLAADAAPRLHHEGLYSLLVRQWVARWGLPSAPLPAYRPLGVRPTGLGASLRAALDAGPKKHVTSQGASR